MSFLTNVEDLVGTCSDTTAVGDFLTAGARIVVDSLALKQSDKLNLYATDKTDAGSGVDVTGGMVISAHKSNYPARKISVEMKAKTIDADSLHYALAGE